MDTIITNLPENTDTIVPETAPYDGPFPEVNAVVAKAEAEWPNLTHKERAERWIRLTEEELPSTGTLPQLVQAFDPELWNRAANLYAVICEECHANGVCVFDELVGEG